MSKGKPHSALLRSPGPNLEAQPAPLTVWVSCGVVFSAKYLLYIIIVKILKDTDALYSSIGGVSVAKLSNFQ